MAYIHRIIGCTAVLLALMSPCADAYGQQAAPEAALTLDQLVGAARRYFRDTAEFPMQQKTAFSVSDPRGRVRETQSQLSEYVFQGYKPREKTANAHVHGNVSFWQAMRGAKMFKISAGNAFWTMLPGIVLSADPSGYVFAAQPTDPAASLLNAQLTSSKPCPAHTMTGKVLFYLPDEVCGTSSFAVHNDLSFHKFAFDVAGLPAPVKISPFGRCMLQRYRVEIEFQSVTLPGDKEPFLVPKQSSAHLETDKGAIVITSVFEPKK